MCAYPSQIFRPVTKTHLFFYLAQAGILHFGLCKLELGCTDCLSPMLLPLDMGPSVHLCYFQMTLKDFLEEHFGSVCRMLDFGSKDL